MATKKPIRNLAVVADQYKEARDARLKKEKEAAKLKEKEAELYQYLIDNLPASKAGGIQGSIARVEIVFKEVPVFDGEDDGDVVASRDKFFKFAKRKGNEDLVSEQMNQKAIKERWEAGKEVPGIVRFKMKRLSLHTVKRRK